MGFLGFVILILLVGLIAYTMGQQQENAKLDAMMDFYYKYHILKRR